jgi:hypothetical protein
MTLEIGKIGNVTSTKGERLDREKDDDDGE